jgi:hypothetical protein
MHATKPARRWQERKRVGELANLASELRDLAESADELSHDLANPVGPRHELGDLVRQEFDIDVTCYADQLRLDTLVEEITGLVLAPYAESVGEFASSLYDLVDDEDCEIAACLDCDVDTAAIGEYYMVHGHVWAQAAEPDAGMLASAASRNGSAVGSSRATSPTPCSTICRTSRRGCGRGFWGSRRHTPGNTGGSSPTTSPSPSPGRTTDSPATPSPGECAVVEPTCSRRSRPIRGSSAQAERGHRGGDSQHCRRRERTGRNLRRSEGSSRSPSRRTRRWNA